MCLIAMCVLSHLVTMLSSVTIKRVTFDATKPSTSRKTRWERYKVQIAISTVNPRLDPRGLRLSLKSTVNRESFPLIAERHFGKVASYNTRIAIFASPRPSHLSNCFSIILIRDCSVARNIRATITFAFTKAIK